MQFTASHAEALCACEQCCEAVTAVACVALARPVWCDAVMTENGTPYRYSGSPNIAWHVFEKSNGGPNNACHVIEKGLRKLTLLYMA